MLKSKTIRWSETSKKVSYGQPCAPNINGFIYLSVKKLARSDKDIKLSMYK